LRQFTRVPSQKARRATPAHTSTLIGDILCLDPAIVVSSLNSRRRALRGHPRHGAQHQ
jgi:hypothetical protein